MSPSRVIVAIVLVMKMMTGEVHGYYTVGKFVGRNKHGDSLWECTCICGEIKVKNRCNLITGNSKSCGCLKLGKDKKALPPNAAPEGASWVQLTQGKWCLVDKEDFDLVNQYEWNISSSGYAIRNPSKKCKVRFLHRLVMGDPVGKQVDHRSLNTLDNRKENLRVATDTQNKLNKPKRVDNKSGFKGVSFHKASGRWYGEVKLGGIRKRKPFGTPEEAHAFYVREATALHGEFARTS